MNLTPAYLSWEQWRENGGLPAQRPPHLPKQIPAQWWATYRLRHIRPKPIEVYNGFFAQGHGALFREPGGNIENVEDQKVYLKWSALDLRARGKWDTQLAENAKHQVVSLPWKQCFTTSDIDDIFKLAPGWNNEGHCVINVEQEILTTLPTIYIAERIENYKKIHTNAEVAFVPLPWVQNGQNWSALAKVPTLLEIFTNELSQFTAAVCIEHASKEGLKILGCLWGAYPINGKFPDPKMYPLSSYKIQAIYTGDDVHNWNAWIN